MINITRQKICQKYQYEERYSPLKLQMCIETIRKCTFHMAHNCWQIEYVEKFVLGGIENYMYCKKYFWSISMKFLPCGAQLPWHVTSPTIYSKHLSHEWVYVLKCTFLSMYKYQSAIPTNIQKVFKQQLQGSCSSVQWPISMS